MASVAVELTPDMGPELIGKRVEILWQGTEDGDVWYAGTVVGFNQSDGHHRVVYDDGDEGTYDLSEVSCKIEGRVFMEDEDEEDEAAEEEAAPPSQQPAGASPQVTPRPVDTPGVLSLSDQAPASPAKDQAPASPARDQAQASPARDQAPPMRRHFTDNAAVQKAAQPAMLRREQTARPFRTGDSTAVPAALLEPTVPEQAPAPSLDEQTADTTTAPQASAGAGAGAGAGADASMHLLDPVPPAPRDEAQPTRAASVRSVGSAVQVAHGGDESIFTQTAPVPEPPASEQLPKIQALKASVAEEPVAEYTAEFESAARLEEITVGLLSREEAETRERALEENRLREARKQAKAFHDRQRAFADAESSARRRVVEVERQAETRVRRRERAARERFEARERSIRRVFRKAEAELRESVKGQSALVEETYGKLKPGRAGARRFAAKWRQRPQPMEFRFVEVRALKNKVKPGRYVMLATLYDRLAGQPLRWSQLGVGGGGGMGKPAATRPVRHRGRFYDTTLSLQQSVHAVGPSEDSIKPGMVIIFELFMLGKRRNPIDQVVAWGALPYATSSFEPVEGKFKLPLLRGEVDFTMSKYRHIEEAIAQDLDKWLANLYLEVIRRPREFTDSAGHVLKEYDVELNYTSELLKLPPNSIRRGREEATSEWGTSMSDDDVDDDYGMVVARQDRAKQAEAERQESLRRGQYGTGPLAATRSRKGRKDSEPQVGMTPKTPINPMSFMNYALRDSPRTEQRKQRAKPFWKRGGSQRSLASASDSAGPGAGAGAGAGAGHSRHASASSSTSRRTSIVNVASARLLASNLNQQSREAKRRRGGSTDASRAEFAPYTYAVMKAETKGLHDRKSSEAGRKIKYLYHSVLADMSFGSALKFEFWVQIFILIVAFWLRIYLHYVGQWLYLQAARVPVYDFRPQWYSMVLKYVSQTTTAEVEIGLVVVGQATNILVFGFSVAVAALFLRFVKHVPEIFSRFVALFGLLTCFDQLFILIVDLIAGNFQCARFDVCSTDPSSELCVCTEGDAFKLYARFLREEGGGVIGVILTLFLFAVLFLVAAFLLYVFLLHIHLNGRMLDSYRRINADDSAFFVPHDMEVSPAELQWIVAVAKAWRGPQGTQRKMAVCDYILRDPLDPKFQETTTHLIIFHAGVDGQRELYRHFLRLPDGVVLEMFGSLSKHFGSQFGALHDVLMAHGTSTGDAAADRFFAGLDVL